MGIIIVLAVVLALAIMVVVSQKQSVNKMKELLRESQDKTMQLEQKIENTRGELKRSRDDLLKGQNALKDARELGKKKLRRQSEQDQQMDEAVMNTSNNGDNHLA